MHLRTKTDLPWTLQRRLRDNGTQFAALLDQTRQNLALKRLQEGRLMITEIAFELGYADLPSFNRAFKRWTGTTPGAYRRKITNCAL